MERIEIPAHRPPRIIACTRERVKPTSLTALKAGHPTWCLDDAWVLMFI